MDKTREPEAPEAPETEEAVERAVPLAAREDERVLEYRSSGQSTSKPRLVTLRRMGGMEAELARVKLESEGIHCLVAGSMLSATHPLLFSDVQLQVPEMDAERAAEILDRPADADDGGEYAEEEFRCPRCHRRAVDLLPLSAGWRRVRVGCLTLLLAPLWLALLQWALPDPDFHSWIAVAVDYFGFPWFVLVLALGASVLMAKRHKRCRDCGHEWGKTTNQKE